MSLELRIKSCRYPGCVDMPKHITEYLCEGSLTLCSFCDRHSKLFPLGDCISDHIKKSIYNIWYNQCFLIGFEYMKSRILIIDIDSMIKLDYYEDADDCFDYLNNVTVYYHDRDNLYKPNQSYNEYNNGTIQRSFYEYTYKYKLYNMRAPDNYFNAIPKDVLDEVIKYL